MALFQDTGTHCDVKWLRSTQSNDRVSIFVGAHDLFFVRYFGAEDLEAAREKRSTPFTVRPMCDVFFERNSMNKQGACHFPRVAREDIFTK